MAHLYDALKNAVEPMSPAELAETTGLSNQYIRNTLPSLMKDGTVKRKGRGKYIYTKYNEYNEYNKDNDYNEYNSKKDIRPLSSGGKKSDYNYKTNNNGKLEPIVLDVLRHCYNCKAYDKAGKRCCYGTVYEGKAVCGIPAEGAALNCPLKQKEK